MSRHVPKLLLACSLAWGATSLPAAQARPEIEPREHVYSTAAGAELRAFVFPPESTQPRPRAAVVVFHGGGWTIGEAAWAFPRARHFARLGAVGVAAQYRLSDQKSITPLEAMADARAVIRWLRSNAAELGVDAARIAAYGWSAGAHLAASAAIFGDEDGAGSAPDALVLVSPAVALEGSGWVERLLLGRARPEEISPLQHLGPGLPPTIVLQGRTDTVTPTAGATSFCERMQQAGNRCELRVYEGVGHLFTPSSEPDDGWPNPDPRAQAAAFDEADAFLRSLGFID